MTPAVEARPKSLRATRLYPSADRVLAVYYALRMDWIAQSAQCDGSPVASSRTGGVPSSAVAFMCDIGRVLEDVLTQHERDDVLPGRWHAYFRWLYSMGEQQRIKRGLCRCGERTISQKLARQAETVARWERDSWEREVDRLSRRKSYREAMRKLDVELRARDLYARSLMGLRGSIPVPPEWTV